MSLFSDLAANRRRAVAAAQTHGVFKLKANGQRYAKPHLTARSEAAALQQAAELGRLNPGSTFEVAAL